MTPPQRRHTDEDGSTSWVERYIKPLITLFVFMGFILGALQMWIASSFVTKSEMERLRSSLEHSHADHMDDYRKIEEGVEELQRIVRARLPRPKSGEDDE